MHITIGITLLAILALPSTAFAATTAQEAPGQGNLGFLVVGSFVVWAGFFAYAFYMSRKTNEMRREIDELHARLNK